MIYIPVAVLVTAQQQVSWGFKPWLWTKGGKFYEKFMVVFSFHLIGWLGFLTLLHRDSTSAIMLLTLWVVESAYSELHVQIFFVDLYMSYLSMSCCTPLGIPQVFVPDPWLLPDWYCSRKVINLPSFRSRDLKRPEDCFHSGSSMPRCQLDMFPAVVPPSRQEPCLFTLENRSAKGR